MEKKLTINNQQELQSLFGMHDRNIKIIENEFNVSITLDKNEIKIKGKNTDVEKACKIIDYLLDNIRSGQKDIGQKDIFYLIKTFKEGKLEYKEMKEKGLIFSFPRKQVGPKTAGQRLYVEAIKSYDIVFGIGPAGTGKTYLAMACAVEALRKGLVRRIILTRPAIEAGESLGFLPGDMYEKISPYLRPLYDALYDMMEAEQIEKALETGVIEVVPLAYMRGRTLNDAFIILDEAQNCTAEQMKMFLTRLGFDSKAVITGDITQSDLPGGKPVGLLQAKEILSDIEGIKFVYLTGSDVVRHSLVQKIIEAYENRSSYK
ncbi:MAG: PhoH family protein [Candidatus Omnitrophica bacterium]|nr:PhoH family protein [Candidatus Omnitrophota bacterium]